MIRPMLKLLLLSLLCSSAVHAQPFRTDHVTAELISETKTVEAGKTAWVGLRLEMIPHWHVYWKFPGDSGLPVKVQWQLPEGWKISETVWPTPSRILLPPLVNFGYEQDALLGFQLEIPPGIPEKEYFLSAKSSWLVCKEECVPEKGELSLKVVVGKGAAPQPWADLFSRLRAEQPKPLPAPASISLGDKEISLSFSSPWFAGKKVDFFPSVSQVARGYSAPQVKENKILLERAEPFSTSARNLAGILLVGKEVYSVDVPLPGLAPVASKEVPAEAYGIFLAAIFAFLGGLLLNLMPCVFPVLGLKVMGLVSHGNAKGHGHLYFFGVLVSFWVITGILLALRTAGEAVGWGFQLQEPWFVVLLIFIFSFLAASLAGFFEVGGSLMGFGSKLAAKDNALGSFFTGVLAVVVATPCTAPFMGTAIGVVLTQPAWAVFLVFTALGAGLGSPFLVLSYFPSLLKILPRPGKWMESLKEFFAFPLAATVLWLFWVLGQQVGVDGVLSAAMGLLLFFLALWIRKNFSGAAAKIFIFLALILGLISATANLKPVLAHSQDGLWKPYSREAVAKALEEKKPVFVDFTAAWCLTCQVNKKAVLDRAEMVEFFRANGVELFLADWTNHDAEITKALEEVGRIGVPVYLAYPAGSSTAKQLPQLLTQEIVKGAFAQK